MGVCCNNFSIILPVAVLRNIGISFKERMWKVIRDNIIAVLVLHTRCTRISYVLRYRVCGYSKNSKRDKLRKKKKHNYEQRDVQRGPGITRGHTDKRIFVYSLSRDA